LAVTAVTGLGEAGSAADAGVTFFRGVGAAETEQIAAEGTLKAIAQGAEDKYLTNTAW